MKSIIRGLEIRKELKVKLDKEIIKYKDFDQAHNIDHVKSVIEESIKIANKLKLDIEVPLTVAIYHDLGLFNGRTNHEKSSGNILRNDKELRKLFNKHTIETMAQAVEDHRASSKTLPRSIYGRIVSDADRTYDFDTIITRCIQHREGSEHMGSLIMSLIETKTHIKNKYADGGYLPEFYYKEKDKNTVAKLNKFANDERFAMSEFLRIWSSLN